MSIAVQQKWEYLKLILDVSGIKAREGVTSIQFDQALEKLGEQGWELVTALPMNSHMGTMSATFFFKRPIL